MGTMIQLALALGLLSAAVMWFYPAQDSKQDIQTIRAMAQALDQDPKLTIRLNERNTLFKKNRVSTNFEGLAQTKLELTILKLTDHPVEYNSLELINELKADPKGTVEAMETLYQKILKHENPEAELLEILSLSFEVAKDQPKEWKELTEFYRNIVDIKNYPTTNTGFYTLKLYMMMEKDKKSRTDLAEMFLGNHPGPHMRAEVEKLLEEYFPQGAGKP